MANPMEVMSEKLDAQVKELNEATREMQSLMAAFDCDPVLDVEVFTFTDDVNRKRDAAGLPPVDRVTFALTKSIESALSLTGDFCDE